jgi:hypothetical protein
MLVWSSKFSVFRKIGLDDPAKPRSSPEIRGFGALPEVMKNPEFYGDRSS